jgi:hypothetical protein
MTAGDVEHKSMRACFIDGLFLHDNSDHNSGHIRNYGINNERVCVYPSIDQNTHLCQEQCAMPVTAGKYYTILSVMEERRRDVAESGKKRQPVTAHHRRCAAPAARVLRDARPRAGASSRETCQESPARGAGG